MPGWWRGLVVHGSVDCDPLCAGQAGLAQHLRNVSKNHPRGSCRLSVESVTLSRLCLPEDQSVTTTFPWSPQSLT